MSNNPLISIIVPVYNVERYVGKTVQSVLRQTYENWEMLLIDDGSLDSSGAICDRAAKTDPRISVIHEKNAGLSFARNAGMECAKGEYYYFLDGDDQIADNLLEEVVKALDQGRYDSCFFGYQKIDEEGAVLKECPGYEKQEILFGDESEKARFLYKSFFPVTYGWEVWRWIYKSEIVKKYSLSFVSERKILAEDLMFTYCYLLHIRSFVCIPHMLYRYTIRKGSLMDSVKPEDYMRKVTCLMRLAEKYTRQQNMPQISEKFYIFYGELMHKQVFHNQPQKILEYVSTIDEKDWEFFQKQKKMILSNRKELYRCYGFTRGRVCYSVFNMIEHRAVWPYVLQVFIKEWMANLSSSLYFLMRRLKQAVRHRDRTSGHISVILLMLVISSSLGITACQKKQGTDEEPKKAGYYLDFSDEFDGEELDVSKWTDYYLPQWCTNPEASRGDVRVEDGCLVLSITKDQKPWCPELDGEIKSSAVMSFDKSWIHNFSGTGESHDRDTWYGYKTKYGYFEIRAKLADCGGGGHQAWWMVGLQQDTDDWFGSVETAEIDVLETFFEQSDTWRMASYGWNDSDFQPEWQLLEKRLPSDSAAENFHTYALEWTPSDLRFYFDGKLMNLIFDSPDYEMGTILNIYTDAGSGVHNDVWPKQWKIDYFRVWKKEDGYDNSHTGRYYLKNRQSGGYMYLDEKSPYVRYGPVPDENPDLAKWEIAQSGNYVMIRNVATGQTIHMGNRKGFAEYGTVSSDNWTAQWYVDVVDQHLVFTNREYPNQVIHTQNSAATLQTGLIEASRAVGQWELIDEGELEV